MTAALLGFLCGIPVGAVALAVAQVLIVGHGRVVFPEPSQGRPRPWAGTGYGPIRPSMRTPAPGRLWPEPVTEPPPVPPAPPAAPRFR